MPFSRTLGPLQVQGPATPLSLHLHCCTSFGATGACTAQKHKNVMPSPPKRDRNLPTLGGTNQTHHSFSFSAESPAVHSGVGLSLLPAFVGGVGRIREWISLLPLLLLPGLPFLLNNLCVSWHHLPDEWPGHSFLGCITEKPHFIQRRLE